MARTGLESSRASYPGFRRRRPPWVSRRSLAGLVAAMRPAGGRRGVERPRSSRSGPEARTRRRNLGPAHAGDERRRGSAKILSACPSVAALVRTMPDDDAGLFSALQAAARGCQPNADYPRGRVAHAVSDQILDQKRKSSQWRLHKLASTGLAESSAESLIQYGVERGIDPLGPLDSGSHQFRRHLPAPDRPSLADCVHPRKVVRQRGAPLLVGLCGHRARPAEAPKKGAFRGRLSWHRCTGGDVHVIVPGTLRVGTPTGRPTV